MDSDIQKAQDELHSWMFEKVYKNPVAKAEEGKAKLLVEKLYGYFYKNPDKLPQDYKIVMDKFTKEQAVCDYVAGMSDGYAINLYKDMFIPKSWSK